MNRVSRLQLKSLGTCALCSSEGLQISLIRGRQRACLAFDPQALSPFHHCPRYRSPLNYSCLWKSSCSCRKTCNLIVFDGRPRCWEYYGTEEHSTCGSLEFEASVLEYSLLKQLFDEVTTKPCFVSLLQRAIGEAAHLTFHT